MQRSDFEEREYEGPLYTQLLGGSQRIAPPGQVFENAFGVDVAMEALHRGFWDIFGVDAPFSGTILDHYNWGWVWRKYGRKRNLPHFPVNLLIQAKRPDFLKGPNKAFSGLGISKSYWRFHVRPHQQPVLSRLSDALGNRALVVYASPAFHTYASLYKHTEDRDMVENSGFVRVDKLDGHKSWNYNCSGCRGIAHSDPVGYEWPGFWFLLEKLLESAEESEPLDDLKRINAAISIVCKELPENPIIERFNHYVEGSRQTQTGRNPEVGLFLNAVTFFRLVGVEWMVAAPDDKEG